MKRSVKLFLISLALFLVSDTFCQTFDIYVSDAGDFSNPSLYKIYKYDENGENAEVFIDEELSWPQDIVFLEDQGIVLISNLSTNKITKYDAEQGNYLGDFATGINGPTRMKIGADSLLYVLQWSGNGLVKRFQLDGTFVDDYTDMGVIQSIGIDWDNEGNLYVSTYGGNLVRQFDTTGHHLGLFISSSLQGPTNIWFDDMGDLLACNWNGTTVKRFDSDGNYEEDFITGLSNPEGVAIYPNGDILIGNGGTGAVKLFDSDGNFIKNIVESGSGGLLFPNAVVLREQTSVAVDNIEATFSNFIRPTIGAEFFLNPAAEISIETIEVYNSSGALVEKMKVKGDLIWNAGKYPEGAYFIIAKLVSGDSVRQKVMVKK